MPNYQKLVNQETEGSNSANSSSSSSSSSSSATDSSSSSHQRSPSVGYHLYLLREQLSRRNVEYMRLSKAKYFITETLLARTVCNLKGCNIDELKTVNNQIVFKHKLKRQIHRLRKLQSLGIKNANPNMESTDL